MFFVAVLATSPELAQAQQPEHPVVREAREFMRGYAKDLLAGDRNAIVLRYDPTGAFLLGAGSKRFLSADSIRASYSEPRWSPPLSFEWQDLSFEPVNADAVVVMSTFLWGFAKDKPPIRFSYTALLRRQDGKLRIRLEDESAAPAPPNTEK